MPRQRDEFRFGDGFDDGKFIIDELIGQGHGMVDDQGFSVQGPDIELGGMLVLEQDAQDQVIFFEPAYVLMLHLVEGEVQVPFG